MCTNYCQNVYDACLKAYVIADGCVTSVWMTAVYTAHSCFLVWSFERKSYCVVSRETRPRPWLFDFMRHLMSMAFSASPVRLRHHHKSGLLCRNTVEMLYPTFTTEFCTEVLHVPEPRGTDCYFAAASAASLSFPIAALSALVPLLILTSH